VRGRIDPCPSGLFVFLCLTHFHLDFCKDDVFLLLVELIEYFVVSAWAGMGYLLIRRTVGKDYAL
jgi:hypothetical protein